MQWGEGCRIWQSKKRRAGTGVSIDNHQPSPPRERRYALSNACLLALRFFDPRPTFRIFASLDANNVLRACSLSRRVEARTGAGPASRTLRR